MPGIQIQARTTTPAEFVICAGSGTERVVKPTRHTSFHLMVMLSDAHTGVAIPYAGVWTTIRRKGKVVYDAQHQPMLSAYMGPHYGDNVTLPGAGHYELTLLISPPVAGRHLEYRHVWLKPHRVRGRRRCIWASDLLSSATRRARTPSQSRPGASRRAR